MVEAVSAIALAATQLGSVIALGPLAGEPLRPVESTTDWVAAGCVPHRAIVDRLSAGHEAVGRGQAPLDRHANEIFMHHLRDTAVAVVAVEGAEDVTILNLDGILAVALDPLDGSSNVDINAPLGTVFSVLPATSSVTPEASLLVPGADQLAAGFILYGPHTSLVLTLGDGVNIFTLDPRSGDFILTCGGVRIRPGRREYAINASNGRHWPLAIRAFIEECVAGADGPRGVDYNTRWLGAVVSEAYRILMHGGIYLYPGDARPGYRRGRLRLLFEANPVALLIEQAGGMATDGFGRILDLVPCNINEHVPLIFGSPDKVERVMALYAASVPQAGQRPLFATRGLFKS